MEADLVEELARIRIDGDHADARRVRDLAKLHGAAAVPFLARAAREGSDPVMAAAIQALGRVDVDAVADRAVTVLQNAALHCDVRAAAADALAQVHSEIALDALLQVTVDDVIVSGAAVRALVHHRSAQATARIRSCLRVVVEQLDRARAGGAAGEEDRHARRLRRAFSGVDGNSGLLGVLVQRHDPETEADLVSWWRSHRDDSVRGTAALTMLAGGVDNALLLLNEGIPGSDAHPVAPSGELDNGPVRHVLAGGAYVVLRRSSPADAFDRLIPFFDVDERTGWFGEKRAEVILLLLIGQLGYNATSWLAGSCNDLHRCGARPDGRWRMLGRTLHRATGILPALADTLSGHLAGRAGRQPRG
jgi:hypothetical protein